MISQSRKALVSAVIAFLGPVVVLLGTVDPIEPRAWALAAFTGIVAGLATWIVPNAPAPTDDTPGQHEATTTGSTE